MGRSDHRPSPGRLANPRKLFSPCKPKLSFIIFRSEKKWGVKDFAVRIGFTFMLAPPINPICHCNYRRSLDGIGGQEFGLHVDCLSPTPASRSPCKFHPRCTVTGVLGHYAWVVRDFRSVCLVPKLKDANYCRQST